MSPPTLNDFPLLTTTGTLTTPPSLPPTPYPRDPLPPHLPISHPISPVRAAHIRQRRKLARFHFAQRIPALEAEQEEDRLAKDAVLYSHLHARRLQDAQAKRQQRLAAVDSDPYVFWDTPRVFDPAWFIRPPVPKSITALTGIPPAGYGDVCMAHRMAWHPVGNRPTPFLADVVRNSMNPMERWDPVRTVERTARFDEMRVGYAVSMARREGKRTGRKCLRCQINGMPCSLERDRSKHKGCCVACERNGVWCIQVIVPGKKIVRAEGDEGEPPRFLYLDISRPGTREEVMRLYVRDEDARGHMDEIEALATSLLEGEARPNLHGVLLNNDDRKNLVLPNWQKAYEKKRQAKEKKDRLFMEECRTMYNPDRAIMHYENSKDQQQQQKTLNPDWKDYFQMMNYIWRQRNGLTPREPPHRRADFLDPKQVEYLRRWYWRMILEPDRLGERGMGDVLKRAERCHASKLPREKVKEAWRLDLWMAIDAQESATTWITFLQSFVVCGILVWVEALVDGGLLASAVQIPWIQVWIQGLVYRDLHIIQDQRDEEVDCDCPMGWQGSLQDELRRGERRALRLSEAGN